jgi:hypothetical protein
MVVVPGRTEYAGDGAVFCTGWKVRLGLEFDACGKRRLLRM